MNLIKTARISKKPGVIWFCAVLIVVGFSRYIPLNLPNFFNFSISNLSPLKQNQTNKQNPSNLMDTSMASSKKHTILSITSLYKGNIQQYMHSTCTY